MKQRGPKEERLQKEKRGCPELPLILKSQDTQSQEFADSQNELDTTSQDSSHETAWNTIQSDKTR